MFELTDGLSGWATYTMNELVVLNDTHRVRSCGFVGSVCFDLLNRVVKFTSGVETQLYCSKVRSRKLSILRAIGGVRTVENHNEIGVARHAGFPPRGATDFAMKVAQPRIGIRQAENYADRCRGIHSGCHIGLTF
jgi:hypothetical protein